LLIPILGNILIGIYDYANRNDFKKTLCNHPLNLDDVKEIIFGGTCRETFPCQGHIVKVTLKDGRIGYSGINSYDAWSLISKLAKERINPGMSADTDIDHFKAYSKPSPLEGHFARPPEVVLNKIFRAS
jgi:hypothetical protein